MCCSRAAKSWERGFSQHREALLASLVTICNMLYITVVTCLCNEAPIGKAHEIYSNVLILLAYPLQAPLILLFKMQSCSMQITSFRPPLSFATPLKEPRLQSDLNPWKKKDFFINVLKPNGGGHTLLCFPYYFWLMVQAQFCIFLTGQLIIEWWLETSMGSFQSLLSSIFNMNWYPHFIWNICVAFTYQITLLLGWSQPF